MNLEQALLSVIAHRLRHHLTNATMMTNFALTALSENDGNRAQADMQQVKEDVAGALEVVGDIMALAQMGSAFEPSTLFSLSALLTRIVPECERIIQSAGRTCSIDLADGDIRLRGTPKALAVALLKVTSVFLQLSPMENVVISTVLADGIMTLTLQGIDQGETDPTYTLNLLLNGLDTSSLIELLGCVRVFRANHGKIEILSGNVQDQMCIKISISV
jgi:hypothetical protein